MTTVYRPRPTPTPAPPEMPSATLAWLKGQGQQRANGVIDALSTFEAERLAYDWDFLARPDQLPPAGNWSVWLYLAGRGSGKTRAGVEWVRRKIKSGSRRIALIAPTTASARDVLIEGESGILAHAWEHDRDDLGNVMGRPVYEPSKRRLTWGNGAIATAFSAEEPDRLRGPQHDCILADELAAWSKVKSATAADPVQSSYAWDMAMMGLRIGRRPQAMVATTPRPIPILRELMRSPACAVTRATTFANRANLAPAFFEHIISKYRGTRLGRQELMGDILEEAEGALWTREMVEQARDGRTSPHARVVVAIDPAVSANPSSSLTGIVVAARGHDGRAYVLADLSGRFSPDGWARAAVGAYRSYKADRIVAEGNQGGDLVRLTLSTINANVPISIVHASRSKQARAEPVAALYEQRRVTHLAAFPELDDQLCTWEPLSGDPSPDRLDALVWALSELMLGAAEPPIVMPFFAGTPRNIPGQNQGVGT
jgi:phage terminase large subunit-like protein